MVTDLRALRTRWLLCELEVVYASEGVMVKHGSVMSSGADGFCQEEERLGLLAD
jgi:hypothetical protein